MDDEGYDDDELDGCGCVVILFLIIAVLLLYYFKNLLLNGKSINNIIGNSMADVNKNTGKLIPMFQ